MKCFQSSDLNVSSSVRWTQAENGEIKSDLELKILKSQNLAIFRNHTHCTDFSFDRPGLCSGLGTEIKDVMKDIR